MDLNTLFQQALEEVQEYQLRPELNTQYLCVSKRRLIISSFQFDTPKVIPIPNSRDGWRKHFSTIYQSIDDCLYKYNN